MIETRQLLTLAALDAAGALTRRERERLQALVAAAPAEVRRKVASFYDSSQALSVCAVVETPSPSVRERILAHAVKHP